MRVETENCRMNLKYMDVEMISNAQIPISDSQFARDYLTVMSSNSRVQALSLKLCLLSLEKT